MHREKFNDIQLNTDRLAHLNDIESYVIRQVALQYGLSLKYVSEIFNSSETCRRLFAPNSLYYTLGAEQIAKDFEMELTSHIVNNIDLALKDNG